MPIEIKDIDFWGIFGECFPDIPDILSIINTKDYSVITEDQWWTIARKFRNYKLLESDWSQISDNGLTEEERQIWRDYRSELRNIPQNYEDPKLIIFPDSP